MTTVASVQRFREAYWQRHNPKFYFGWVHFGFTCSVCLLFILVSAFHIQDLSLEDALFLPLAFLFANFVEYIAHRYPMHHKTPGLGILYNRHSLEHHFYYTHEAMTYEGIRDFRMVLFPPALVVFISFGVAVPIGILISQFFSLNAGYLFVIVSMGYYLNYEILHLVYHAHPDAWFMKLPFINRLKIHHTKHHDLKLMTHYNFNITYPIFDWICKTKI